jgi:hypothetical protein
MLIQKEIIVMMNAETEAFHLVATQKKRIFLIQDILHHLKPHKRINKLFQANLK